MPSSLLEKSTCAVPATRSLYHDHVLGTYGRFDLAFSHGAGCNVWEEDGREFLDFGAGIAVCSLGHCHPAVTRAVTEQAAKLVHTSNLYHTRPQAELAARLAEIMQLPGRFFFCNSGAEANEGLIKLARKFANSPANSPSKKSQILTFRGSFHGRTMAGISATGQDKVKTGFAPLLEGFEHLPYGDLEAARQAITPQTAAVLIEPVQGEGGIHIAHAAFLQGLRQLCDEHNALLLFDEVQCGLGRTGDWCAWRSIAGDTVDPDAVSWAKGIANGYPLGAFWIREKALPDGTNLASLLGPGSHGTTYGGNPLCCAAALAVLDTIQSENLLTHTLEMGALLREELRALNHPHIREVRAIGLMIGVELEPSYPLPEGIATPALALTTAAMNNGLLIIPAGERVIRMLPPLNVSPAEIHQAVGLFSRSLA